MAKYPKNCLDCNRPMGPGDYFLVKRELFISACNGPDMICYHCFEKRIGRKLVLEDFHEDICAFKPEDLKGGTVQELRYSFYLRWISKNAIAERSSNGTD